MLGNQHGPGPIGGTSQQRSHGPAIVAPYGSADCIVPLMSIPSAAQHVFDHLARPSLHDYDGPESDSSLEESDAAFSADFCISPAGHTVSNHMDPIYEETSLSQVEAEEVEAAMALDVQDHTPQPAVSSTHAADTYAMQLRNSMNSPSPLYDDAPGTSGSGASAVTVRSSAPGPASASATAAAAASAAERKKPLLQRLSATFKSSAAATAIMNPAGTQSMGEQRSSLMQKMGAALYQIGSLGRGDSPRDGVDMPHEHSTSSAANSRPNRENRALGANSVPVVQAYTQEAMQGGRPNLRRRGCYTGLVGSYRMSSVPEGVATAASAEQDEKQLSELKGWLEQTTQPWQQHSRRLHKLQVQQQMEQEVKEREEPKVVLPQAPSKPKLKTFSLAVN